MQNTLVFMRTHIITRGVISEFLKLKKSGYDCVLFIDNRSGIIKEDLEPVRVLNFFGEDVNCFLFNEEIFKKLNLPLFANKNKNSNLTNVMWFCADYSFYCIKKYFPSYDFYWHFDYDVFCNGKSYEPFFKLYCDNESDLLVSHFCKLDIDSEWSLLEKSEWIYNNVQKYASFFPVVRLSSLAIDFLYTKRVEHSEIFERIKNNKLNRWINCELFVPTELLNNNFTGENIEQPLRFSPEYDLNEERLFENQDNLIYHPVKGNFIERLNKSEKVINRIKKISISIFGIKIGFFISRK